MDGPPWRARVALAVQSALLAVLYSWPLLPRFSSEAVGSVDGDGLKHLWNLWWMRRELQDGEPGLLTRLINFPTGMDFYPIEPLNGLIALMVPAGPVGTANLLALLHLALLGVCAGALGARVGGTALAGLVAGALAQGAAFTAFTLQCGVGELRELWWLPLGLLVWWQADQSRAWRWYAVLGLVHAAAILSCFYHGFFLSVMFAVLSLPTVSRVTAPRYALAVGLALALALPAVSGFAGTFQREANNAATESTGTSTAIEPDDPGAALQLHELYVPRLKPPSASAPYSGGRYLGIGVMLLALAGLAAAPRRALPWVATAGVGAVLALGNVLWWDGEVVLRDGQPIPLPMGALNRLLGRVAEPINFPARAAAIPAMSLAVLAAIAVGRWPRLALLVPLALLDVERHDRVQWPRETFTLAELGGLETAGGEGAVADLSFAANPDARYRRLSLSAQITLDRPLQSVPIERMDWRAQDGNRWMAVLPITALARGNADAIRAIPDLRADFWLLRARGFDRVLLTHATEQEDYVATAALTLHAGAPVARSARATVWAIPEVEASPEEAERWEAEQQARVAGTGVP